MKEKTARVVPDTSRIRGTIDDYLGFLVFENSKLIFVQSILVLLALWAALAYGFKMVDTISSPLLVWESMAKLIRSGDWVVHFTATVRRILYGFIVTLIIGTTLGVTMGLSEFGEKAFQDYVIIGLALPDLFAAVFAAMWFGISDTTPMVAGALIAFPFTTQNVYEGVKDIDRGLIEMGSSFGVSRPRMIWRVVIKSVLPEWFAGARYGFAICWKVTTLTEVIAASSGLGFMIQRELQTLSLTGVITWVLLFTIFILIVEYGIFQQIEKRVFEWRQETTIGFA